MPNGHKKVLLELGVVDAVLQAAHEDGLGLVAEFDPRPRKLDPEADRKKNKFLALRP
jgi:hypothetical protein